MSATREEYTTLFDALINLESDVKDINEDKKDRIAAFAERHGVNKKAIMRAFKDYKEFLKDESEFHEVDGDTTTILDTVIGTREEA